MKNHSDTVDDAADIRSFALETVDTLSKVALTYYGKRNRDTRFDESLVTEAELDLTGRFEAALETRFPSHRYFGRGTVPDSYTHDGTRYLWVFDAIDGADNFQTGIPIWGMSLALLENFWPVFGIFAMPATGDRFHARAGGGAYHNDTPITIAPNKTVDDESILLVYSRFHRRFQLPGFPGKIRNYGSATAHICYVAMGRADAAVMTNESFRGLAAGRTIIEAAGGTIVTPDGTPFFLNEYLDGQRIDSHLIVAGTDRINSIRRTLASTG